MSNVLKNSRGEIDRIDHEILNLFNERMKIAREIGESKRDHNLPIENPQREREILVRLRSEAQKGLEDSTCMLFRTLFELSKAEQRRIVSQESSLNRQFLESLQNTPELFPKSARVGCCGIPGAYAQVAADRLFSLADITYFNSFKAVFQAVEQGLCRYGVLPVENSTAGTVAAVCDLMRGHNFSIVRSIRLPICHALLVNPETRLSNIKEVFSHEHALKQCSNYLEKYLPDAKLTSCATTAQAARLVAESGRSDAAAIGDISCVDHYHLTALSSSIQDSDYNYTRFICISKTPEIYPGADRISIMTTLPHQPGALNSLLERFSLLGLNLCKLESRPIPGRNFEYMFYFDFEATVSDPDVRALLTALSLENEEFVFLGNYREI